MGMESIMNQNILQTQNLQIAPNWNVGGWADNQGGGGYDPNTETKQEPAPEAAVDTTQTSTVNNTNQSARCMISRCTTN